MIEQLHPEFQYLDLLKEAVHGIRQPNRTGIDCWTIPGAMMKFDLEEGYPLITTKQTFFKPIKGELIGFLRGADSADEFRDLGCKIWDQNANENKDWLNNLHRKGHDDLGRIYGVQWRDWTVGAGRGRSHDQLFDAISTIINNPYSRRIIINAWRPDEFDQMALPPCHVLYQFIPHVGTNKLHLCMYQRSCDMFLGVPFNIASSALFLSLMAKWTGYQPGTFTHFLADAHVYVNHLPQVVEQLIRDPFPFPNLNLDDVPEYKHGTTFELNKYLDNLHPDMIKLDNYQHHEALRAPMAV